jgi:hypothetical protein
MRNIKLAVPIAAFALVFGSLSAEAQERGERRGHGNHQRDNERRPQDARARQSDDRNHESSINRENRGGDRAVERSAYQRSRGQRDDDRGRSNDRYRSRENRNDDRDHYRGSNHAYSYGGRGSIGYGYRGPYAYANGYAYSPYYYAPRPLAYRYAPRHYYGSGGRFSIYFGFGSGYLYGAPYYGRIYGYRAPAPVYGSDQYYGDIRLRVDPEDAEVYVDGYYAGIVDDFDGQYQRLALEAGPHKIEINARGLQAQVFDVYVDPSRTVELRADLFR